ncbi:MAG: hypothetical protein JST64_11985, partial [Actinobacteria bacterium]|nr:hypothetical protein [Actinomycetota bacterium]
LDGFLPLQTLNFGYKITKNTGFQGQGGADNNDDNVVQFTLKQNVNDGIWCRKTVRIDTMPFDGATTVQDSGTFRPTDPVTIRADGSREVLNGCIKKVGLGPMTLAADGSNRVTDVEVDQFVSHYDHPTGGNLQPSFLDAEVRMTNRNTNKVLSIDYVTVSATAGAMQGSNIVGYPKPLDPFTVTWSPVTPNPGGDGGWGDASFNVWGSVSVPNNDVRVIWNYETSPNRYAGQLGFPIFNAGKNNLADCGSINLTNGTTLNGDPTHCRPALVAAALGSWQTLSRNGSPVSGTWPTLPAAQLPDPLASTGSVRFPFRQALLQACVVDSTGSGVNGDLLPRVSAVISVGDRDGMAVSPGASVRIKQWQSLRAPAFEQYADALTNNCALSG